MKYRVHARVTEEETTAVTVNGQVTFEPSGKFKDEKIVLVTKQRPDHWDWAGSLVVNDATIEGNNDGGQPFKYIFPAGKWDLVECYA
jgi:hypothetical protein